jgi:hypothetical protein
MSKSLIIIWQYLRAFVLIYACLYAGIFLCVAAYHDSRQHYRHADSVCLTGFAGVTGKMG